MRMSDDLIESVTKIDRIIHEPARMAILLVLSSCVGADFVYLQAATRLDKGNLSLHISRLEEHGIVEVEKKFVRKTPRTFVRLTKEGKAAMRAYWRFMEKARKAQAEPPLQREKLSFDPDPEPSAG
jgi:DNA-binding transcriptional ArsR family regulator